MPGAPAVAEPGTRTRADTIAAVSRARWTTRALGPLLVAASLATGPGLVGAAGTGSAAGPGTSLRQAAPGADEDVTATPLTVTLTSMTPAEIPSAGTITLTGVVTNDSEDDWTDINVAPFTSAEPITTRDELAEAAETAADVAVGERLTDEGTYMAIGDLGPGARAPFTLRLPVTSLLISGAPGVYWIGVHALGTNTDGRDPGADGRARTFIALVSPRQARQRSVPVSVVLPLRERARRAEDGSLNRPGRWARLTRIEGRLSRIVDFGASAGTAPVTWLVDPAVLDALDDYRGGNPPLSLGAAPADGQPEEEPEETREEPGEQESESASPSPSPEPEPGTPTQEQRDRASTVLERFLATARTKDLLTLGYADPDVVSLARRRAGLIKTSVDLAAARMKDRGLTGSPTIAPPSGYFDPDQLREISSDALLLLTDRGRLANPPLSRLPSGQELVLSDERASTGGPAPTTPTDPLALRQRILAEGALEVTQGAEPTRPIVVTLPYGWNPGYNWRQADFFGGLRSIPWVRLAPVPRGATETFEGELAYGRAQLATEIVDANVSATRTLVRTSRVLGNLLVNPNEATDRLTGSALQASAYGARPSLESAAEQVLALDASVRRQIGEVQVTGTDFVTLSGGSGSLTVTLVNGLEQPVTVGLDARADSPEVVVETPEPVSMQPGQRTTLRLQVASGVGVHDVTIFPVTTEGEAAGTPLTFSLRTSQVGRLIWYIIAAGGTLLVVMIVRRIALRIRDHRWRRSEAA